MDAKILDYSREDNYISYEILNLSKKEVEYLYDNLDEKDLKKTDNTISFKIYFKPELYPFQSEDSKLKLEDYIKREEIEIKYYISSFLEDMR